jgi:hypothetical protein
MANRLSSLGQFARMELLRPHSGDCRIVVYPGLVENKAGAFFTMNTSIVLQIAVQNKQIS